MTRERACRVCGCTERNACITDDGPCFWLGDPDRDALCSACAAAAGHVVSMTIDWHVSTPGANPEDVRHLRMRLDAPDATHADRARTPQHGGGRSHGRGDPGALADPGGGGGVMNALALIHVAKKQLGLDEEAYRGLLERLTGKRSAKDMDFRELEAVIAEMRRLGFSAAPKLRRNGLEGPYAAKLQALWIAGWNLGIVRDRRDKALTAFVLRQTGIPASRWLRLPEDAAKVIEALKAWLAREGGVDWSRRRRGDPEHFGDDRFRIVWAQAKKLERLGVIEPGGRFTITNKRFADYSGADWIALMNALGTKLRAVLAEARKAAA